ncbi:LysR family transcriptional regulator [Luteolibacter sp. AS25]|uniref:LysR family transcriptional regulator n=1 Tax=Luteolibacter sp. AS25 TaxID=3135776 RepID=UPI00398B2403
MNSPEIKDLNAALSLKRSGGFVDAAKELGITQPAVSGRIAKLEQNFGFPLFHRRPGETTVTSGGRMLFPVIEELNAEFSSIIQKISYWRRANEKEVNILVDGSELAERLLESALTLKSDSIPGKWFAVDSGDCLLKKLENYEVDLVIGGSFLKVGYEPEFQVKTLVEQSGLTVAWNASYHDLSEEKFSLSDALGSTVILPIRPMAMGFRRFLQSWCETSYQFPLNDIMEVESANSAVELCTQGYGVLLLPGDASNYLDLKKRGLSVARCFDSSLPNAYNFGIRYRTGERNPVIVKTIDRLVQLSRKLYEHI